MKQKKLWGILFLTAVTIVLFQIAQLSLTEIFSSVMAFPFEQIGLGLRALSLSGTAGNIAAIFIYCLICFSPVFAAFIFKKKRTLYPEDGMLVLLSALLFAVIYFMINPGIIAGFSEAMANLVMGKVLLGCIFYSAFFGYIVLRLLRLFTSGDTEKLTQYISVMLGAIAVLFVILIFGTYLGDLFNSMASLREGNTGNEYLLGTSYVFLSLQFVVNALPYVLNIFVISSAMKLVEEFQKGRYSAETSAASAHVSRLCIVTLVATVLSNVAFNILQLLFVKSLLAVNSSVIIPVFSVTFVLAALLLTKFVAETKQLKDDNDMFI